MLSRKYYRMIAKVIKNNTTLDAYGDVIVHHEDLINDMCQEFARDNNLFNHDRFVDACND